MLPLLKRLMRGHRSVFSSSKRNLSIHEYQAQRLLAEYGIPVPKGRLVHNASDVRTEVERLGGHGVLKAQILAGDRTNGTFQNGFENGVQMVSS